MAHNTIKPENLVGRQVYFKMSEQTYKKLLDSTDIYALTPYKLYTVVKAEDFYNGFGMLILLNDKNQEIVTLYGNKFTTAHIGSKSRWILKRRAK